MNELTDKNSHAEPALRAVSGQPETQLVCALKVFSRLDGALIALAGVTVLLGWALQNQMLMRVFPGLVAMNPLTAVCFIAAGVALRYFWSPAAGRSSAFKSRLGWALAGVLVLVGLLNVLDYLFGWNFGLDQVLFRSMLAADQAGLPNRMAPNTALNFLASGLALLFLLNSRGGGPSRTAQYLALLVAFYSLTALLGCAYSADYLFAVGPYIPMAAHTAGLFLLLSLGLLFARTDCSAVALFVSQTPGGAVARRLLPFAFAIPAGLGALWLWGERLRIYNSPFGVTIMVLVSIAAFTGLIWWNAVLLNWADLRRREAESSLQKAHHRLELRVEERNADLLRANEALRTQIAERQITEQRLSHQEEEKRKLEEQFLCSQRMESLGALAGGIAHDLNNALVPVLLGSQLLRENGDDKAHRETCLDLISSSAQRCTQMVKQILSFARGSRGQNGILPVRHLMAEMTRIARDTFPKSISIQSEAPMDLWNIRGDAVELHQVLMNLCVNARDAMPNGGQLTLRAENVKLSAEAAQAHPGARPGPHVVVSVADTGTGIPPELLARIFDPFFTTKAPDKGTGLGLSTVANIVKKHNGFVEVHSTVGKGTEFRIFLPATESAPAEEPKLNPAAAPAGRGELILVVDDEQLVLQLAKTTLENCGFRVLTAPNGLKAVACFEAHKDEIRALVTDRDMPLLDGTSAVKAIQTIRPNLPIIMASGPKRDTERFAPIDFSHLIALSKPYGVDQLLEAVAKALAKA